MEEQKYYELIKESRHIAVEALKKYLEKLNLNPEAFEHIYNIKIIISKEDDYETTSDVYLPDRFKIQLLRQNLDFLLNEIEIAKKENNPNRIKNIQIELAITILHEMLHANRSIFIENGIIANKQTIDRRTKKELTQYAQSKEHNIEEYIYLAQKFNKEIEKKTPPAYIPLKIIEEKDKKIRIIAYYKETEKYSSIREITGLELKEIEDINKGNLREKIEQILNSKSIPFTSTKIEVSTSIKQKKQLTIPDYYPSEKGKYLEEEIKTPKQLKEHLKKLNKKLNTIDNQDGFEEVMVEAIAHIIILSSIYEGLNFNEVIKKYKNWIETDDQELIIQIIERIGPRLIKWFLTSAYDEIYHDLIQQFFKEKTDKIKKHISAIYDGIIDEMPQEFYQEDIYQAEKIINEKLGKPRR